MKFQRITSRPKISSSIAIFLLLLTGCSTKYVPPPDNRAETARVRLVTYTEGSTWIYKINKDCKPINAVSLQANGEMIGYPRKDTKHEPIGIPTTPLSAGARYIDTRLLAGPVNIEFYGQSTGWSCGVAVQFTPRPDTDYQLEFESSHVDYKHVECVLKAYQVESTPQGVKLNPVRDIVKLPNC